MSKLLELKYQIEDLETVSKQILNHVSSKTILFYGEMGAGKTTLIKSLVKLLGSDDDVSSPTFSIVNDYESIYGSIHHFDLYRISDEEEALNFGFEDYLNTSNWVLIEWPQNVQNLIPIDANIIEISYKSKTERILKLSQNHNINPRNQQKVAKF